MTNGHGENDGERVSKMRCGVCLETGRAFAGLVLGQHSPYAARIELEDLKHEVLRRVTVPRKGSHIRENEAGMGMLGTCGLESSEQ